jgi:hypothetical protein
MLPTFDPPGGPNVERTRRSGALSTFDPPGGPNVGRTRRSGLLATFNPPGGPNVGRTRRSGARSTFGPPPSGRALLGRDRVVADHPPVRVDMGAHAAQARMVA